MKNYNNRSKYRHNQSNDDIFGLLAIILLLLFLQFWLYIMIIIILFIIYKLIIFIIDKDLFSKFKSSLLYYQGNSGKDYLEQLKRNQSNRKNSEYNINCLKKGLNGENKVLYTLTHISLPMYIMHDVKLKCNDLKAQIDFVIVTKKTIYILEIKDLNGNLDIEDDGTFTRKFGSRKTGIKNPLTQNNDHEKLIKAILKKEKLKGPVDSIIVLANDNSYVHFKKGAKQYKNKIFRNDKLEEGFISLEKKRHIIRQEPQIKHICDSILKYQYHEQNNSTLIDQLKQYRQQISKTENVPPYIIFHDTTIMDLAKKLPTTIDELHDIVGLGKSKIEKYGIEILNIIAKNKDQS